MTCLYMAVKVHEPQAVDPETFALLSRGECSGDEIQAMETIALDALDWRMNPPTAVAFLQYFFELIPNDMMSPTIRDTIFDLAKFQTELAVSEYCFASTQSSTIAFSSLMNASECIDEGMARCLPAMISNAAIIDCHSPLIVETQQRLYEIITKRPNNLLTVPTSVPPVDQETAKVGSSFHVSPRSIVGTCRSAAG